MGIRPHFEKRYRSAEYQLLAAIVEEKKLVTGVIPGCALVCAEGCDLSAGKRTEATRACQGGNLVCG